MSTMRSWFFGSTHTSPASRSRKRARVGLSIDSDSSGSDELPDAMPRTAGTAERERGKSDMISAKVASNMNINANTAKAAPTTWALDWTMTDSSDDDSIQRRRSMSEPHVYGDDSSSLEEEAPFLPSPTDLVRGGSASSPSPFLLPAPRRLRYPEDSVYQHNRNAIHNNNHGRGTRRRTFSTEDHGRHEFWRSASLDSDDDQEVFVHTTTSSSSSPSSPTRQRRTRKFWTPYRLLMVLFLFATYTTFWLPIPSAPQATYSLRGSRISLDHATTITTASTTTSPSTTTSTANQSRPLPTLDDAHQRGGLRLVGIGGKVGSKNSNNLILARPAGTASLAYRNSESLERYYQQEAFHHESDVFFRWSWYCNVIVLSMFVVAAAREYKNRGQAVCDI